ncbi:MAG: AbrB/MazE/SpoVT family DNA-binding domain-containing protein [Devosiaceae bacterium]|nr:AbrB/MazE/SpoVT family DNA-binding domain-containing protein [Devosiaceae bacterium]
MPLTTLKEKGQITLPAGIRKQLHVTKGDLFNCEIVDGKVVMTPQKVVPKIKGEMREKGIDISKYIGATAGTFSSASKVDEYIRKERNSWD